MKEKDKFYANELRERLFAVAGYQCFYCGDRAYALAHRIAKSQANLKKYGAEVIHHPKNLVVVCDKPSCNDRANIGNNPRKRDKLVKEIMAEIGWWEEE